MKNVKDFGEAADNLIELKAHVEQKRAEPVQQVNGELKTDAPAAEHQSPFELQKLADAIVGEDAEFQIGTLIERGDIVSLFAKGGSGKTLFVIDLGIRFARGERVLGMETKRCKVLMLLIEAGRSGRRRFKAYCKGRGIDARTLDDHFRLIKNPINLFSNDHDLKRLVALLNDAKFRPDVIIIDTQIKTMPGAEENSSKDAGIWINHIQRLQALLDDPTVFPVAHTGKDESKGQRGSTAFTYNTEVALFFTKNKGEPFFNVEIDRARDRDPGDTYRFNIKSEEIEWGTHTLEMGWCEWDGKDPRRKSDSRHKHTPEMADTFKALRNLVVNGRRIKPNSPGWPSSGCIAVTLTDVKTETYKQGFYPEETRRKPGQDNGAFSEAKRKAFERAVSGLRRTGSMTTWEEAGELWCWVSEYGPE